MAAGGKFHWAALTETTIPCCMGAYKVDPQQIEELTPYKMAAHGMKGDEVWWAVHKRFISLLTPDSVEKAKEVDWFVKDRRRQMLASYVREKRPSQET